MNLGHIVLQLAATFRPAGNATVEDEVGGFLPSAVLSFEEPRMLKEGSFWSEVDAIVEGGAI